jgi:hypothetical protein
MKKTRHPIEHSKRSSDLFGRVVSILEQARSQVVRSVNHCMVLAYWQIGREIFLDQQQGKSRADYGKRIIESLSEKLTDRYGRGFSVTSLKYFRTFYLAYADRTPEIGRLIGDQSLPSPENHFPRGDESRQGFHPNLSWSHYRALMRVENIHARAFYEIVGLRGSDRKRRLKSAESRE